MITLSDPVLGDLELRADPYIVASLQIGSPAVREVRRARALADGEFDDSRFRGGRAITIALRFNERPNCAVEPTTIQGLLDALQPYLSPRRRPTLSWALPGSESDVRWCTVRGVSAPVVIERDRHPVVVCSFVSEQTDVRSTDEQTLTIDPGASTELGRSYDRTFDTSYPASGVIGSVLATNRGNAPAHWRATIYGICTDSSLTVGGVEIAFTENGGLSLPAGGAVTIDTRERTMYYLDDPTQSKYEYSNFTDWQWDDLLLEPGQTTVRFDPATSGVGAQVVMSWYPTWEG